MAYRKRYVKRRNYKKRKPSFLKKAGGALSLAYKAWKGFKYLSGMINSEKNKSDYQFLSAATMTVSQTPGLVFNIGVGDSEGDRVGYSILVRGLCLTYLIRNNATTPAPAVGIRIMIIKDNQNVQDGTSLSLSDILENVTSTGIVESLFNDRTVGRFTTLYNRVHYMDTVKNVQVINKHYIPLKHHVRYNGDTSSDIQKGGIYYIAICDNTNVSYLNPVITMACRTYYYDN